MFDLYLITDRRAALRPLARVAEQATSAGGARVAVQFREKDLRVREALPLARDIRAVCRQYGCGFYVNDRLDLALAAEADGVQLTANSLPADAARRVAGDRLRLGVSIHSPEEAESPENTAADFTVLGPVFFTPSKARYGEPLGLEAIRKARALTAKPIVAVGGIKESNAAEAIEAGADAVAVISAVMAAEDAAEATLRLLAAIDEGREQQPREGEHQESNP